MSQMYSSKKLLSHKVHIIALGFEYDRIIEPILINKADKVWFVLHKDDEFRNEFFEPIITKLKKENIEYDTKKADIFDFIDLLDKFKEIIKIESNNDIFVNISSGSKIAAVAFTLGCMMWKGIPYYVQPKQYVSMDDDSFANKTHRVLSKGVNDIYEIPKFPIEVPDQDLIDILYIMTTLNEKDIIKRKDLLDELKRKGIIDSTLRPSAQYNLLRRRYIDPLQNQNFIEITQNDKDLKVTKLGYDFLRIFR